MGKLVTKGNIAVFEYPEGAEEPTFELDDKGTLWIYGYKTKIFPFAPAVRSMLSFKLNLIGYKVVGEYVEAEKKIQNDFSSVIIEGEINANNCVVMIKK